MVNNSFWKKGIHDSVRMYVCDLPLVRNRKFGWNILGLCMYDIKASVLSVSPFVNAKVIVGYECITERREMFGEENFFLCLDLLDVFFFHFLT